MTSRQDDKTIPVSELRRDPVTGNWIVVARGRGERPRAARRKEEADDPIETCPFEDPQASGNAEPVLEYRDDSGWSLQVIPNKHPAFAGGECGVITRVGPYSVQDGRGFHEVIITRDHFKHLATLPAEKVVEVLRAYKERYIALKDEECVKYVSIFHNHGKGAGASLTHPHSQLAAIPILPSNIRRSLMGSNAFYKKHGKCVHCAMLGWEREDKKRIVLQNNEFIAICPFVSRDAYEVRIFPQSHSAYFENINDKEIELFAEVFREVLLRIYDKLDNPPYNFYLHTAPTDGNRFDHYHWHFEIRPKAEIDAGFEFGTGVEISTMEPEKAAAILRE